MDLVETLRGWVGGLLYQDEWDAPVRLAERAPAAVRAALGVRLVRGLPVGRGGDFELAYACGDDLVLHVRSGEPERRTEALRAQQALAGRRGIPAIVVAVDDGVAQWLVEERLRGVPLGDDPHEWWQPVTEWLVGIAERPRGAVRDGAWWREAVMALPSAAPQRWRPSVAAALERIGDLPAVPAHGWAVPARLMRLDGGGVGAQGWGRALADAVAGLDLLTLSVHASPGGPHPDRLADLLEGTDPPFGPLLAPLAAVGVEPDAAPALAIVALAQWTAVERLRQSALGTVPGPPRYTHLFERLGDLGPAA